MSKFVLLLLANYVEVCASIGSPVMCRTKWPTILCISDTVTTAPQSPFSFHLGCDYAQNYTTSGKEKNCSNE